MPAREYSKHLGIISDNQFQAALDRFGLGRFVQAESIPFGLFGQNVFLTSTEGEYVLRGKPHFSWQFPTEQFYAQQLNERTQAPVPWPYLIDPSTDIFGWSYVIMPRMPGLQLAAPGVKENLGEEDRRGIARAMGENLALMQGLTWPFAGRYDLETGTVQPFELLQELAWPFPVRDDAKTDVVNSSKITYSERAIARIRGDLTRSSKYNDRTTTADIAWVEELIALAQDALAVPCEPYFLMEDYKEQNVVVECKDGTWRVSGVFDLMEGHFGDGEADLSRIVASYLDQDAALAREFVQAYAEKKPLHPGFAERFPVYMLLDRLIIWEYFQRNGNVPWNKQWTFRDWAGRYISCPI